MNDSSLAEVVLYPGYTISCLVAGGIVLSLEGHACHDPIIHGSKDTSNGVDLWTREALLEARDRINSDHGRRMTEAYNGSRKGVRVD